MKTLASPTHAGRMALLGLLICSNLLVGQNRNPTSKLYIADLEGQSEIDTGERIEDIRAKSVHNAQGTIIETMEDANNSMVFSNGTGLFLDPETRLEVRRFVQEPFTPNRTDFETEPSISQTYGYMPRGRLGICAPKMVAGSSMVYATPHASVSIRGKKVVVEADDFETKISSVEGEVTVEGDGTGSNGRVISGGQQAIIRRLPGQPPTVTIQAIPEEEIPVVEDKVTMACNARRTIYFDVAKKKSEIMGGPEDDVVPTDREKTEDETGEEDGEPEEDGTGGSFSPTDGELPPGEFEPTFGDVFLDDEAGEGEFELIPVEVTPVSPVDQDQVAVSSPSAITTGG